MVLSIKTEICRHSLVGQQVKDPVLSLLWHGFHLWLRNFRMLQVWPKKKKKTPEIYRHNPAYMQRFSVDASKHTCFG